jgi:hypothetical protein
MYVGSLLDLDREVPSILLFAVDCCGMAVALPVTLFQRPWTQVRVASGFRLRDAYARPVLVLL